MKTIDSSPRKIHKAFLSLLLIALLAGEARADLVISNWTMTDVEITFDISGTIDAGASIGPTNSENLYIGVTGDTDWVNATGGFGSVTNHGGATRNLTGQKIGSDGGALSDNVRLESSDGQPFMPGDVINASVVVGGPAGSLTPANLVRQDLIVSAGYTLGTGMSTIPQAPHQVGAYVLPAPILIDGFTDDLTPTTMGTALDGSMLGGESDLSFVAGLAATVGISGGAAQLSDVSTSGGNLQIVYDGDDNGGGYSFGLMGVDFTGGGSNDRFAIDVESITGSVDIAVRVWENGSDISSLLISDVTTPGILEFLFDDFSEIGNGADFAAANQIAIIVFPDIGATCVIDSFMVRNDTVLPDEDPVVPVIPVISSGIPAIDFAKPTVRFLKKKKLKAARPRHVIRGEAVDNSAVVEVEVKGSRGGWKRAKLKGSGKWKYRTPRLKTGNNKFKIRAMDANGNSSKIERVRVRGR